MNPKQGFVICSTPEQDMEERKCNYERYRGLVQNDFANSEYDRCRRCCFHANICGDPQQRGCAAAARLFLCLSQWVVPVSVVLVKTLLSLRSLRGAVLVPDLPG